MDFRTDSQRRAVFANMFTKLKLSPRYSVGFKPESELSYIDLSVRDPTYPYRDYSVALTEMSPSEFFDLQLAQMHVNWPHMTREAFVSGADPKQVEKLMVAMEGKADWKVPIPVLLYSKEGKLTGFQEGRKRAMAAQRLGMERIPVIVGVEHYT